MSVSQHSPFPSTVPTHRPGPDGTLERLGREALDEVDLDKVGRAIEIISRSMDSSNNERLRASPSHRPHHTTGRAIPRRGCRVHGRSWSAAVSAARRSTGEGSRWPLTQRGTVLLPRNSKSVRFGIERDRKSLMTAR